MLTEATAVLEGEPLSASLSAHVDENVTDAELDAESIERDEIGLAVLYAETRAVRVLVVLAVVVLDPALDGDVEWNGESERIACAVYVETHVVHADFEKVSLAVFDIVARADRLVAERVAVELAELLRDCLDEEEIEWNGEFVNGEFVCDDEGEDDSLVAPLEISNAIPSNILTVCIQLSCI